MDSSIKFSIVIIIAAFFTVTYFFSVFEKLADYKGTISYYKGHFKKNFIGKLITVVIPLIIFSEIIILLSLLFGLYRFIEFGTVSSLQNSYIMSSGLLLVFLIGQRFAKDYQGATSIAIYLIFNILGLFFLI